MLRRVLAAGAVVLFSVGLGVVPAYGIVGGAPVEGDAGRGSVRITIGGDAPRACSGAVVHAGWVLTVASCLTGQDESLREGLPSEAMSVNLASGDDTPGATRQADRVVPHPDRDLALLRVIGMTSQDWLLPPASSPVSAGQEVTANGMGRTADTWVPERVQAGATTVGAVTETTFALTAQGSSFAACEGDAGGAVVSDRELVGVLATSGQGGCLGGPTADGGASVIRTDGLEPWVRAAAAKYPSGLQPGFEASYASTPPATSGLGGFDFMGAGDRVVAFDFEHSGKQDHLLMYRPASNMVVVAKLDRGDVVDPDDDVYRQVFRSTSGLGGYQLTASDQIVAMDFDHDGQQDDLVIYRAGTGGSYTVVTHGEGDRFTMLQTLAWSWLNTADARLVPFDFDRDGKVDELLAYRPSHDQLAVVSRSGESNGFSEVVPWSAGDLPDYPLGAADKILAYDREGTGTLDDLWVYRSEDGGNGRYATFTGSGSGFTRTYSSTSVFFRDSRTRSTALDYDHDGFADDVLTYTPGTGNYVISIGEAGRAPIVAERGGFSGLDLSNANDRIIAFDATSGQSPTSLLLYRPGAGKAVVADRVNAPHLIESYASTPPTTNGLGGFDFMGAGDQAVAFDFEHSGKQDHLLMYRPGSNTVIVAKLDRGDGIDPDDDVYRQVYRSTTGIGGYQLTAADQIVALDFDHDGQQDELVIYRPGTAGTYTVVTHNADGQFTMLQTFTWSWLKAADARMVPFDFDRDGKVDELLAYRPSHDQLAVVSRSGDSNGFSEVVPWSTGDLPDYPLASADKILAYDREGTGTLDDLWVYRSDTSGNGRYATFTSSGTGFARTYSSTSVFFRDSRTLSTALDYDHDGFADDVLTYTPGTGNYLISIGEAGAAPVWVSGGGLPNLDLLDDTDRITAFDAESEGGPASLLAFRPGTGKVAVASAADASDLVSVDRPAPPGNLIETFAYPDAERLNALLGIELISGDGHIVIDEGCVRTPDESGVGSMRVLYTLESGGRQVVCLAVLGEAGRIDLMIPNVYSIRGDGYETGAGHEFVARVDTRSGPVVEIDGDPDSYNPVGIGADPASEPTTLLQIRVPS
ncbi:S1 family peptidase [Promicromonospora sp. NPDC019610]|uniref:S1 family peptidase n=1 Tax=Promicromonospora sp. NPDC019610 TaxID=3364405 RepID=UPI00379F83A5